MKRLLEQLGAVSLPLALWSCSSAEGGGAPPSVRTPGFDGGREARAIVDAMRDAAPDARLATRDAATRHVPDAAGDVASDHARLSVDASDASIDNGLDGAVDACAGKIAIFAGTVAGASTFAYGATRLQGGGWQVSSLPTNVGSPPAILGYAGGFVAAFDDVDSDLQFATSTWSWSSPVPVSGATTSQSPSLAAIGTTLHVVYQATNGKYFHGTFTPGSGWDAADDPVGGSEQGFGPSPPVVESVAGSLIVAYSGDDGLLYDNTWASGTWSPANPHDSAQVGKPSPAIVALEGAASDALIVYTNSKGTLYSTARTAGAWSVPTMLNTNAFTGSAPSLAPLAGGRAVLAYLGNDELPYFCIYDPAAAPPWTAPESMNPNGAKLASPPSVARGVCGDDAIAVLTGPLGVATARYVGGSWTSAVVIDGTAGATFASVASEP